MGRDQAVLSFGPKFTGRGAVSVLSNKISGMRNILIFAVVTASAVAQSVITTYAGAPYVFDGGGKRATNAPLGEVSAVAVDAHGTVYIADPSNHMVMKFDPNGALTVVAGNGIPGNSRDGGPAESAALNEAPGLPPY